MAGAIFNSALICGTMFPLSVYCGKILLQVVELSRHAYIHLFYIDLMTCAQYYIYMCGRVVYFSSDCARTCATFGGQISERGMKYMCVTVVCDLNTNHLEMCTHKIHTPLPTFNTHAGVCLGWSAGTEERALLDNSFW